MWFRKIASNVRITSAVGGGSVNYELDAFRGGHQIKQLNVQIVVRQKSSNDVEVGLFLRHGPDGQRFVLHSTPIAPTVVGSGVDLLNGDSDGTKMFGDVILPVLIAEGASIQEWANVDVYLVAKPF